MARQPTVTYEEVVRAAFKLLQKGQNPTLESIHQLVGNKGSRTTIHKYKKQWLETMGEVDMVHLLPATVPKALMPAVDELWGLAVHEAGKAHAEDKHTLETMAVEAKKRQESAEGELQKQYADLQELEHLRDRLLDQVSSLKDQLGAREESERDLRLQLSAANNRITDLEQARETDRQHYDQLLTNEKAEHKRQLEHLQQQVDDANAIKDKEIERSDREIDYCRMQVARERDVLRDTKAEHERATNFLERQLDARNVQNSDLQKRLDALEDQVDQERKAWTDEKATLQSTLDQLRGEHGALSAQLEKLDEMHRQDQAELAAANTRNEALSAQVNDLTRQLNQLQNHGEGEGD